MSEAPKIYDDKKNQWIDNPRYDAKHDAFHLGSHDYRSDTENRDAVDPDVFLHNSIVFGSPSKPVGPTSFLDGLGRQLGLGDVRDPRNPPLTGHRSYHILQDWKELGDSPGMAFDTGAAVNYLREHCNGGPTGYCQRAVYNALHASGMDVPRFGAAKEMYGYLSRNANFAEVASGLGNNFDASTSANYHFQVGDIMVYRGNDSSRGGQTGQYGHIQMCVGFDQNSGKPIFVSDFQTSANNMSGLRDPVGHGGEFVVFRQHTHSSAPSPSLAATAPGAHAPHGGNNVVASVSGAWDSFKRYAGIGAPSPFHNT